MGTLRGALYTVSAARLGRHVLFTLTDPAARIVAEGVGPTVHDAQLDARRSTTDESARQYLERIQFPEELIEHDAP